jgi:hypothetical protein
LGPRATVNSSAPGFRVTKRGEVKSRRQKRAKNVRRKIEEEDMKKNRKKKSTMDTGRQLLQYQ